MQINTQTISAGKYPANQELKFIKSKLVCTLAYALYTQFSILTFYPRELKLHLGVFRYKIFARRLHIAFIHSF